MKLTYDHLLFAALTCGILLITMVNGHAFAELGAMLGQ